MNRKILVTFAFAFGCVLAGCSGSYSEESERASSELAKKGDPGKGDPGKGGSTDEAPSKDPGKEVPTDDGKKGDPNDVPEKDPGKDVPTDDSSCFTEAFKANCQSDEAWKSAAEKICGSKGLSVGGLSTAADCKEGSTVAKITCCK